MARLDDATRSLRVLGYATPRATAVADGPQPGEARHVAEAVSNLEIE